MFGIFYLISYFFLLFYLTIQFSITASTSPFLSLTGSDENNICKEIPQTISTVFQADLNGYWETHKEKFNTNSSLFSLEFQGSNVGNENYGIEMQSFQDRLNSLALKSYSRNAFWNVIAMSTFIFKSKLQVIIIIIYHYIINSNFQSLE